MKILAVVQARLGSSRLPGKVLKPVAGAPMLARMLERVQAAQQLDDLVVATTTDARDQPIVDLCQELGVPVFAGHPTDLLDRHYKAAESVGADAVAKIPSDCPLIDPRIIDRVLARWRREGDELDFLSNLHPATYPDGHDVEVMHLPGLELAWREAQQDHEREHTTPFFWDQPERFRIGNVAWETGLDYSMSHRMTVDYKEDYEMVRRVYEELYEGPQQPFSLQDILDLLDKEPQIAGLNAHLAGVNWYRNHLGDLRTVSRRQTVVFDDT